MKQEMINDLVNKAIILLNDQNKHLNNSFELFGSPIAIDNSDEVYFIIQEIARKDDLIRPFDIISVTSKNEIKPIMFTRVVTKEGILKSFIKVKMSI